ncbi:hypothetical protein FPSE_02977 [Fusarium pseudograminearum CS3096]|uniref:Uncharacterized protein n=1 Tax=Fusarium pseudograminearum (strain CS3096) TaxID=1028729 RepID=K3UW02_FUSPC|nr:hypothetical protein FPSE_02977 [Fusarium pseudograminearum CS3096]EKJ76791.1 hypothetical protein FPSE_02977 [Fusarium pseudograminearum CS3096]
MLDRMNAERMRYCKRSSKQQRQTT